MHSAGARSPRSSRVRGSHVGGRLRPARADEPGEALAYWTGRYGRALPKPLKRGVADAVQRLHTERALVKYDAGSRAWRFSDVLNLAHASPAADRPWQGALFVHAHERRHERGVRPDAGVLPLVAAHGAFPDRVEQDPELLLDPDELHRAGFTWESALSLTGGRLDQARLWEALIPSFSLLGPRTNRSRGLSRCTPGTWPGTGTDTRRPGQALGTPSAG